MKQIPPFSDKICYYLNCGAVGDLMAAAAIINYAINIYHNPRNSDYRVACYPEFKDLFSFVPTDKLITLDESHALDRSFAFRRSINQVSTAPYEKNVARLTTFKLHNIHHSSVSLIGSVINMEDAPYVPLELVEVSQFGIDFDKAVILSVTSRDRQRSWKSAEILKTSEAIRDMGLIPVYIGKTIKNDSFDDVVDTTSAFEYPGFGINLINKTNLRELYSIMYKSRAVMGIDSGPMHIAMATNAPVICGFTSVRPDFRIPYRKYGVTIPIIADEIGCRFCQSDWNLLFHNFTKCPRQLENPECVDMMTADKFIAALKEVRQ